MTRSRLAVALAVLATTVAAPRAQAATFTRVYLSVSELSIPNDTKKDLAALTLWGMSPGETRYIEGRIAARSTVAGRLDQTLTVYCRSDALERVIAARNHEGTKYAGTGDSYVRDRSGRPALRQTVRLLFRAPHASGAVDYRCVLQGGNGKVDNRIGTLVAVRSVKDGAGNEIAATWLQATNEDRQGAHWVDMRSDVTNEYNCQPGDLYGRCDPRPCPSADTNGECQYVFPDRNPRSVKILEMKVHKKDLRAGWRPGDTAVVYANFVLTSCYKSGSNGISASCDPDLAPWAQDRDIPAIVLYRLEVADIDSTGHADACAGPADAAGTRGWTYWPSLGHGYAGGDYRREVITYGAHHKTFYSGLARRTTTNPDCTRMLVRVYIEAGYAAGPFGMRLGQPIKVDAARLTSGGFVKWTHSNGAIWLTR